MPHRAMTRLPAEHRAEAGGQRRTPRGLSRSVNNIAWQSLGAAFTEEKGIVDESSTRITITETHASEWPRAAAGLRGRSGLTSHETVGQPITAGDRLRVSWS